MKQRIAALRTDQRVRYIFIGGVTFLFELGVLWAALSVGASGTLAVAISFILGLGASFVLQKIVAFEDRRSHKKIVLSQLALYGALIVFNFLFTIGAVWLLERYMPVVLIRTVALAITVIWNYYLYRTVIFAKGVK